MPLTRRLLLRRPGMSGIAVWAPVLMTMVSAVTSRRSLPAETSTRFSSRNAAVPVTTVTESIESSIWKFLARITSVSDAVAATDSAYHEAASASCGLEADRWMRALVGTQPMLMQVPPYISSDCSTITTRRPRRPIAAASVFPPLPKPMTSRSACTEFIKLDSGVADDPARLK